VSPRAGLIELPGLLQLLQRGQQSLQQLLVARLDVAERLPAGLLAEDALRPHRPRLVELRAEPAADRFRHGVGPANGRPHNRRLVDRRGPGLQGVGHASPGSVGRLGAHRERHLQAHQSPLSAADGRDHPLGELPGVVGRPARLGERQGRQIRQGVARDVEGAAAEVAPLPLVRVVLGDDTHVAEEVGQFDPARRVQGV
jgi:hypothetical protein